jgi:hypothetical protein
MKRWFLSFLAGFFLLIIAFNSSGAPIPAVGPVTICGTVSALQWVPEEMVKGIPGMSGSAGHDRIVPAHFLIALKNFDGVDSETARRITGYLASSGFEGIGPEGSPPLMVLKINHPDKNYLQTGMTIEITGYTVRGDEGGTWTSYERVDRVSSASIPCNAHSDVVRRFFNLINDHRIDEALGMMAPSTVGSDGRRIQWIEQFQAITSIGIVRIEPLAIGTWSDQKERYKIVLTVQVKPEAADATIPYYGWYEGENIRWVIIQSDDQGQWRIKGIGTGP